MNKAEEQYLYQWGRATAQSELMAWSWPKIEGFAAMLKEYCLRNMRDEYIQLNRGGNDYRTTIIHAIDGGQIKDWPSFVEYMTGEDYEQKPKCEYCNDTKEVPAPHYTKGGEPYDCDFIRCPKCGGDDE